MSTKICPICRKEFGNDYSAAYLEKRVYCSYTCSGIGRRNADPSKKKVFTCEWCNKPFEEWAYRKPRFCSRQCTAEFASRQPKPAQRRPQNFVTVSCEQCGKEYVVHKCMVTNRKSRFCSRICKGAYYSLHMQGVNHPRYIGGTRYKDRGPNWITQRRIALTRDGYLCQLCGYKPRKGKRRGVDVHHIEPYKVFNGDYLRANTLSNLITLCRSCHVKVEHYNHPCPKRLF